MNEQIKKVEIVKIFPTEVWYEKDFFGTVHIKMQHMAPDMEPFTFIQIHYNYAYTSNSHQYNVVKKIGQLLGVENMPERIWTMPEEWKKEYLEKDDDERTN